ncbi:MAG: hypothetical protein CMJ54_03555 [Planctomycetaceae bacterium]|nr:hypothetical protein [Planctomycetaceae bacterium]
MPDFDADISQTDADRLCFAASCVFFALLRRKATMLGTQIVLPKLLCPTTCHPPPEMLDDDLVAEATAMLLRLGVVEIGVDGKVDLILVTPD